MRSVVMLLLVVAACASRSGAPATPGPTAADGSCPAGTKAFASGCGPAAEDAVAFEDGCYASCAGGASCPSGTTCETAWIHPCAVAGDGDDDGARCLACGGEAKLCVADRP